MKRFTLLTYLFIAFLATTGCTNAIHDDLSTYVNVSLAEIINYEQRAINTYNTQANKENLSHKDLQIALEETIIPTYSDFLSSLEAITPTTKEVDNLHHIYIEAAKKQLEGFIHLKDGLEGSDPIKITEAEASFKRAKTQVTTFRKQLSTLTKAHNIEYALHDEAY